MTSEKDSTERRVLFQYYDPVQEEEFREVAVPDDDPADYGTEYAIITQGREPGGEWEERARGFARDLEVNPDVE